MVKVYRLLDAGFIFITTFIQLILLNNSSKDKVLKYQYKKLKKTIDFAWKYIPFYQRYWKEKGFEPSMFSSLDDINRIPTINKNLIRENFEDFVPVNVDKRKLKLINTGGTTGMPLNFYIDIYKKRAKELAHTVLCQYYRYGYKRTVDKIVILRTYTGCESDIKKGIYWKKVKTENAVMFSPFHLTRDTFKVYITEIRKIKPKYIRAYPSALIIFCNLMKVYNEGKIDGLKGVICSSENIYEWQRVVIRDVLGVEIFSFYGHNENTAIAVQDQNTNKIFFDPFYGYTEFIKNENIDFENKKNIAQIIATPFDNYIYPFIRYETADYVAVSDSNSCYMIADEIIGREQEFVYDADNNPFIFSACQNEPFGEVFGIETYQYIQNYKGELDLLIQLNADFDCNYLSEIKKCAEKYFNSFKINIIIVDQIEKTKAGKFRYLIQNINDKNN